MKFSAANIPYVSNASKIEGGSLFINEPVDERTRQLFSRFLRPEISLDEDGNFLYWQATARNDSIEATWQYKLLKNSNTFSSQLHIKNLSNRDIVIPSFPIAEGAYRQGAGIKYWKAVPYEPVSNDLSNSPVTIRSRRHSSDYPDEYPYWEINAGESSIYHALAWPGGWQADFRKEEGRLFYSAFLPPEETQLTLHPQEKVQGPEIMITATDLPLEMLRRQVWLTDRERWYAALYDQPVPSYPLIYNTWYAIERDLSKEFIVNQLKAMKPYDFDAFVIDDGWFVKVGRWDVDTVKFPGNALSEALQHVRNEGILAGIWSCPQLIATEDTAMFHIDYPGRYVKWMKAWLIDMAGTDFTGFLTDHMNKLVNELGVEWWKYDQDFFADETKQGKFRNVLAFQNAFLQVRRQHPGLYIESCMSGGRMINEFTNAIAQIHWSKDATNKGLEHAWSNFAENLGALQFLQPYMNQKWIINPEKMSQPDTSTIRFYAHSCLPGSFGISADLYKIPAEQQEIFIREAENYKKLVPYKRSMIYEIKYPEDDRDYGYIVFYNPKEESAAVIYGRKSAEQELNIAIPVYADLEDYTVKKLEIRLKQNQLSGIQFIRLAEL